MNLTGKRKVLEQNNLGADDSVRRSQRKIGMDLRRKRRRMWKSCLQIGLDWMDGWMEGWMLSLVHNSFHTQ